jgi:hypothetical protein
MNQSSWLTRKLAEAQEAHTYFKRRESTRAEVSPSVEYRLYTEFYPNLLELTARYFDGATLYFGTGLYEGNTESGGVIEIVATKDDLQKVVFLAGDIKQVNGQLSVLVTYAPVTAVSV